MSRGVGDELVILDLSRGIYFGLNRVGCRIWQLISEGKALGVIAETLSREYEVDVPDAQRDVLALAGELKAKGLVSITDEPAGPA